MMSKDFHALIPKTYKYVTLNGKWDFTDVIKSRILRCEMYYPGLYGWIWCNHSGFYKREDIMQLFRERSEDATLLVLKTRNAALEVRKSKERHSFLEPLVGGQLCRHLDVRSIKPVLDVHLQYRMRINLHCSQAPNLW